MGDEQKNESDTPQTNPPVPRLTGKEPRLNQQKPNKCGNYFKHEIKKIFASIKKMWNSIKSHLGPLKDLSILLLTVVLVLANWRLADYTSKMQQSGDSTYALSKESFIIENRPWLAIDTICIDRTASEDSNWIEITCKNYGRLPALQTYRRVSSDLKERIQFTDSQSIGPIPSGEHSLFKVKVNKNTFKRWQNRRGYLYVFGLITYTDAFHGKDTTRFCAYDSATTWVFTNDEHNEIK